MKKISFFSFSLTFSILFFIFPQEEEQDAPATQELPAEAAKATEEVISEVAPATEVSEEEAPPSAEPAEGAPPASEEKQPDVQTTQPSLENETNKEEDVNVAEKAAPSKPAAKKPLVSRKPALKPVAAKKVCFQLCWPFLQRSLFSAFFSNSLLGY